MDDTHEVVAAYWAAAENRDCETFGDLIAEQVVYEAPQFRDRFAGAPRTCGSMWRASPATGN